MAKRSPVPTLMKVGCLLLAAGILVWAIVVKPPSSEKNGGGGFVPEKVDAQFVRLMPEEVARLPIATRFDYPMGSAFGALTYNAQEFANDVEPGSRLLLHLGDDLNGIGGTDSDLGDAVYAVAAGEVVYAGDSTAGWGKVVIVAHRVPVEGEDRFRVIQSFYGHVDDLQVYVGKVVVRGERMANVGPTATTSTFPHLHFELRESRLVAPGVGYSPFTMDRLNPEKFLAHHRGAPEELLNPAPSVELEEPVVRPDLE